MLSGNIRENFVKVSLSKKYLMISSELLAHVAEYTSGRLIR